jgi:hypothetical protein
LASDSPDADAATIVPGAHDQLAAAGAAAPAFAWAFEANVQFGADRRLALRDDDRVVVADGARQLAFGIGVGPGVNLDGPVGRCRVIGEGSHHAGEAVLVHLAVDQHHAGVRLEAGVKDGDPV